MPEVNGKKYPYTPAGKAAASAASKKISDAEYDSKEKKKAAAKKAALAKMKGKTTSVGKNQKGWSPTQAEVDKLPSWMKGPRG